MKNSKQKWLTRRDLTNPKHSDAIARRAAKAAADAEVKPPRPRPKPEPIAAKPPIKPARRARRAKLRRRASEVARVAAAVAHAQSEAAIADRDLAEAKRNGIIDAQRANVPNWANQGIHYNKGRGTWAPKNTSREDARRAKRAK